MTAPPRPAFLVSTPPGEGALHGILLLGSSARDVLGQLFRPVRGDRPDLADGSLALGQIVHRDEVIDDVVVAVPPADLLGEPVVHLTCHGGRLILQRLVDLFGQNGLVRLGPDELAARMCAGGHLDTVQAEAARALPGCLTWRSVRVLAGQLGGALGRRIEELARRDDTDGIDALLATAPFGRALLEPPRVALVGRPNVGKSSLMNRLVGYDRSIVCDRRGTTVDRLGVLVELEGVAVELVDTGGIMTPDDRELDDPIHRGAAEASRRAIDEATLPVLVLDATEPTATDALYDELVARGALAIYNKVDLVAATPDDGRLAVSAKTGAGLDALLGAIAHGLWPVQPGDDDAVVFTARQQDVLEQAREATGHRRRKMLEEILEGPLSR